MQLPQELLDLIVEEIPDDLSTFKACSLTSRAFVTSARARLFHTVRLLPPSRYPTAKETTPCQKFYKLLSSCPHLAVLVKDLQIVEGNDRDQEWQGLDNSGARWISKASRTLSLILPLLHLERFCFQAKPKLDWETLSRSLKSALKDLFAAPQLRVLVLRGIVIKTPQNLISMITEGNGLRSLALSYIMARRRVPELSIPSGWQPRLQSLAFSDHYTSARFARALAASNLDFSHLRSLSLSGLNNPEIRALFEAFPPTNIVDTLRIWCPLYAGIPQPEVLGLASLPRLRTLRVRALFGLPFFRHIMEQCTAGLETVEMEGMVSSIQVYPMLLASEITQWAAFVQAVRHSPVAKIDFLLAKRGWVEQADGQYLTVVDAALDELAARDVVVVRDLSLSTSLSTYTVV